MTGSETTPTFESCHCCDAPKLDEIRPYVRAIQKFFNVTWLFAVGFLTPAEVVQLEKALGYVR